jgi:hypothetical protein
MREMRSAYKILVGKSEGRSQLERPKYKSEDNIGMYLRKIRWENVEWIHVAQDRCQWLTRKDGNEPSVSIKGW